MQINLFTQQNAGTFLPRCLKWPKQVLSLETIFYFLFKVSRPKSPRERRGLPKNFPFRNKKSKQQQQKRAFAPVIITSDSRHRRRRRRGYLVAIKAGSIPQTSLRASSAFLPI